MSFHEYINRAPKYVQDSQASLSRDRSLIINTCFQKPAAVMDHTDYFEEIRVIDADPDKDDYGNNYNPNNEWNYPDVSQLGPPPPQRRPESRSEYKSRREFEPREQQPPAGSYYTHNNFTNTLGHRCNSQQESSIGSRPLVC